MIKTIFCIPTADIMLTEKCNFRCKYCFEHKEPKEADEKILMPYFEEQTNTGYFPFGGEPLLSAKLLDKMLTFVENSNYPGNYRENILKTLGRVITNGSLIKENAEILKKHKIELQISIDGPEEINDINRVLADGKTGTFNKVMENVKFCKENNIRFSFHGVVSKDTLKHLFTIFKFFYETLKDNFQTLLNEVSGNIYQIIFEEDFTDENIDEIIDQIDKTATFIMTDETFSVEQRRQLLKGYLTRKGGICGLGGNLLSLDTQLNIYPCHRLSSIPDREKYKLGNVYDPDHFANFEIYNSYQRMSKKVKGMYSVLQNNFNFSGNQVKWFMWCPATNHQTCNNIYYQNPKYNVMHVELNRFIDLLFKKYGIGGGDNNNGVNC